MAPPVPEYAAILASPIFAPDRRPASAEGASTTATGSLGAYAALGAVTSHAVAMAVIAVPGGGTKTLHRGEEIDGWRMIGVDSTQVFFERNGLRHTLVIGAPPETANIDAGSTQAASQ
jgi:general secretion pathway protein N